ncbi:hypothetical protein Btru_008601 [Bulinus truncatus]|nr:hypothetical protein Btru_008601 [Bulinus truncatus]
MEYVQSTFVDINIQTKAEARIIFQNAVNSVLPHQMIWNKLHYRPEKSTLYLDGTDYELNNNVYIVGFGKAVIGMARAIEDVIGHHMVKGVLSVPQGIVKSLHDAGRQDMLLLPSTKFKLFEGAPENMPDFRAHEAAMEIKEIASAVSHGDVLIVLISGGGSALLPAPEPPVTLDDMLCVTRLMSLAGASIIDLNTVRKQIDLLKGGGLVELAWPAKMISLILSDVIGDPLDFIASGPTVPDLTRPQDVLQLFSELDITEVVPPRVLELINRKLQQVSDLTHCTKGKDSKDSKTGPWSHVQNVLVGTNKIACRAACEKSIEFELLATILSTEVQGNAREVGKMFAYLGKCIADALCSSTDFVNMNDVLKEDVSTFVNCGISGQNIKDLSKFITKAKTTEKQGICIVAGGETTVRVTGDGKGGRNQELATAFAIELESYQFLPNVNLTFMSAGTDGQDGPTSSAGAVVNLDFMSQAQKCGLNVVEYLDRNDSHTLLSLVDNGSSHVITGLTGTNVMDIYLLIIKTQ